VYCFVFLDEFVVQYLYIAIKQPPFWNGLQSPVLQNRRDFLWPIIYFYIIKHYNINNHKPHCNLKASEVVRNILLIYINEKFALLMLIGWKLKKLIEINPISLFDIYANIKL